MVESGSRRCYCPYSSYMAHNFVTFFVLKINIIIDNYCLLIKRLTLELSLRKLANWPRSL